MNTPMHRFKYTKLTKEEIGKKLVVTESGPKCVSEYSDVLVGKSLKIVTDNGPTLNYTFKDKRKLVLAEDGGAAVEAGYGALTLQQVVFFSHIIPKTQKGYSVFVDLNTNLVTVFEVWLSSSRKEMIALFGNQSEIEMDNREVQRQIYFGYVEVAGQEAPKERHHLTNRLEGAGMYWKQDTGIETLEFYPSIISSNFVELTRHADDLSYCSPSDYILINDNMFIYERTECEFSGIMTMYVVDMFTETQAGMRLGFNEKDEMEYYIFRGKGKVVGHLTSLAPFDEHGEKIDLGMPQTQPTPKGQRIAYRPLRTFTSMTEEEVHQAAEKSTITFTSDPSAPQEQAGMMGGNTLPFSELLIGKEFTLRYDDGPVYNYKVIDLYNLQWRKEGETQWHKETYRAFEADEKLVFFGHLQSGSRPRASVKIALDLINGLTTCIHSKMGTKYYGNEVSYKAIFGVAEMKGLEAPQYVRHEFTDELVGRAYTRSYSDAMTSMHLYTTPHSSAWTIYTGNQTLGMQWCAPAIYVKLRDGVYIFDLVEEACNGAETCIIENDKTLRACGFGFSGGSNGVNMNVIGAIARHIGCYDVKHFFGPKAKVKGA
jgi:hypothetical protein